MMHGVRGSMLTVACHTGSRFSANAFGPSFASSVWKIFEERRLSFSNGVRSSLRSASSTSATAAGIGAGRDEVAQLRHRVAQRARDVLVGVQALQRALLRRLHRERRVGDDALRVLVRLVEQLLAGHDRVEQAHLERAFGRDEVGAEQELHCLRPRDLPGQAHGRTAAREQPALRLHDRELRLRARDPDVDAAEHLHAARGAEPVHRGDHRLVERPVAQHRARAVVEAVAVDLGEAFVGDLLLELGDLRDVALEVRAGEERVADAGDDRDPRVVVGGEPLPRFAQQLEVLHVARVAGFRTVDRDPHDVIAVGS